MTRDRAVQAGLPPAAGDVDWWLLDGSRMVEMRFADDGRRVRSELVTDPVAVARARAWWDLAVRHSAPDDPAGDGDTSAQSATTSDTDGSVVGSSTTDLRNMP